MQGNYHPLRVGFVVILAAISFVACGDSESPNCTSAGTADALRGVLLDARMYGDAPSETISSLVKSANLKLSDFRTLDQNAGQHSSRCVAKVSFQSGRVKVEDELSFADHFPGDRIHIIEADLHPLRAEIEAAAAHAGS